MKIKKLIKHIAISMLIAIPVTFGMEYLLSAELTSNERYLLGLMNFYFYYLQIAKSESEIQP